MLNENPPLVKSQSDYSSFGLPANSSASFKQPNNRKTFLESFKRSPSKSKSPNVSSKSLYQEQSSVNNSSIYSNQSSSNFSPDRRNTAEANAASSSNFSSVAPIIALMFEKHSQRVLILIQFIRWPT